MFNFDTRRAARLRGSRLPCPEVDCNGRRSQPGVKAPGEAAIDVCPERDCLPRERSSAALHCCVVLLESNGVHLRGCLAVLFNFGLCDRPPAPAKIAPQIPALTEEEVGGAMATFKMWATEEGMLEYSLEVSDITNLTMAHIHIGNSTESGAVAVQLVPEVCGLLPCSLLTDCCLLADWLSSACLGLPRSASSRFLLLTDVASLPILCCPQDTSTPMLATPVSGAFSIAS